VRKPGIRSAPGIRIKGYISNEKKMGSAHDENGTVPPTFVRDRSRGMGVPNFDGLFQGHIPIAAVSVNHTVRDGYSRG